MPRYNPVTTANPVSQDYVRMFTYEHSEIVRNLSISVNCFRHYTALTSLAPKVLFYLHNHAKIAGLEQNRHYNSIKGKVIRRIFMCDACGCGDDKTDKTLEEQVKDIIESIRPNLQSHGGDIELVSIEEDKTVKVRLQGACQGCAGAKMTMKMGVERLLKENIPEVKEVIAVD